MKKKKYLQKTNPVLFCIIVSLCSYFNAAKFSIKLFYFLYFTVSFVSQRDKYEIVTETHPFKNS